MISSNASSTPAAGGDGPGITAAHGVEVSEAAKVATAAVRNTEEPEVPGGAGDVARLPPALINIPLVGRNMV